MNIFSDRFGWLTQLLCLAAPAIGVMLIVLGQDVIPPILAFHDPVTIETPRGPDYCCFGYYGAISNVGVMLWTSSAAVCLFAGLVLATSVGFTAKACALIAGGALTGVLAVDDLFLLHDDLLPFHGIDEKLTFAVYGAGILSYLFFFRNTVLDGNIVMLALSLFFFGVSTWAGFHVFFAAGALADHQKTINS